MNEPVVSRIIDIWQDMDVRRLLERIPGRITSSPLPSEADHFPIGYSQLDRKIREWVDRSDLVGKKLMGFFAGTGDANTLFVDALDTAKFAGDFATRTRFMTDPNFLEAVRPYTQMGRSQENAVAWVTSSPFASDFGNATNASVALRRHLHPRRMIALATKEAPGKTTASKMFIKMLEGLQRSEGKRVVVMGAFVLVCTSYALWRSTQLESSSQYIVA